MSKNLNADNPLLKLQPKRLYACKIYQSPYMNEKLYNKYM